MSIARRVLREICKQGMASAYTIDGTPVNPCIFVFAGNAEEQLEAAVCDELTRAARRSLKRQEARKK